MMTENIGKNAASYVVGQRSPLVYHQVEDDGERRHCICGWVSRTGPNRHQDRHIISNPDAPRILEETSEWMRLWNGDLANVSTPSNEGQRHSWIDWVSRVGIYGYDPVKLFPWHRTKHQWIHDAGWSNNYPNPDSVFWDRVGYPKKERLW